ncbi:zinc transporter 7-A [Cocos nucifera]|uniref:Zinc transporter 7-A n=1 Tax=Cocos nucifera TaxID=13894 RepID=A0A8K0HUP7_COCNU|nr:zinc transporter 7-A [Cocos nucifera]
MLLPFVAGFLAYHERAAACWVSLRQLGRRRVRLLTLALTTAILFLPALASFLLAEGDDGAVSVMSVGWPLINTVVFGVILAENYGDEKATFSANFRRDFVVTFFCTLVLELIYFPKLSLPGFLFCGLLLWISVRELGSSSLNYVELGSSDYPESLYSMIMKPIRHILSERKSRKIALFLLINTAYMVVEFVAGFMSNSLGLISDACHMLFDCAALAIGLYASYISRLPANSQFNYGRGRFEVLSGYVNAVFLVLVGALIVLESFERILDPQEISTNSLLAVSIGGLVVNMVGLVFFHEEHHHAHGGGGTCSHSHSHSHTHHHHHHHQHSHEGDVKSGHHQYVGVPCELSVGHSHDGHEHHGCNHDGLPHSHSDECGNDTSHCHSHEHGQNSRSHEHNHDNQLHHAEVHFHQRLDDSSRSSQNHCSEGHAHNDFHVEKESSSKKEPLDLSQNLDHAHCDSCTEESSVKGKSSSNMQKHHHHIDHNMEGIFLHVLADTMGSVGVVISTLLIKYKGWLVADPACSIFISVMIVSSVIPLLRNSAEILLQRVPRAHEQDLKVAVDDIMRIQGVCGIQNMHVWNFTNADIVGTLHLHVLAETDKASALRSASELLHEAGIEDLTIQVDCVKG